MKGLVWFVPCLLLVGACQSQGTAAQDSGPTHSPTLERLFELGAELALPATKFGGWRGPGHEYFATEGDGEAAKLVVVDAAKGTSRPFHEIGRMENALASIPGIDAARARSLANRTSFELSKNQDTALFNEDRDLFVYHFDTGRAVRLTNDDAEEVGEVLSPDGKWISFVRESNLYAVSSQGGVAHELTTGGDATHLFGRLDWVYQEEVYGRGNFQANWWSPDSTRIAFLALDETDVPEYTIADTRERHPTLEAWRYPKAGDPNPKAKLGVVDVASGLLVDFDLAAYPPDVLIVRVGWTPDAKHVVAQLQDRTQTWLELVLADPATGRVQRLFRESSPAWSMPSDGPFWLEGTTQFVWPSERDGYQHLYLYERDGTLVRQVTQGPWEVDSVLRVDAKARVAWIVADRDD
ncbi:MAG TPA: DPP IV N-terminal domain-containing protein, partial [Planctomycetota bacterium]|nr:DPP IV N-terminal domain-containing protein [Planctomycetota bacterium]